MSDPRDIRATDHDSNVTTSATSPRVDTRPGARSATRPAPLALVACSLLYTSHVTGCVIPPPIITVVEEEYPPFISSDFVSPTDRIIQVTTPDAVTLKLNAIFDQNREDLLYVAWYSQNDGVLRTTTVPLVTEEDEPDYRNVFYTYGPDEVVVDPCDDVNANTRSDVVWAYVSDESWATTDDALGIQEQLNAFKVSYSWVLEFNVLCTGT